jgi:hypothetical protein
MYSQGPVLFRHGRQKRLVFLAATLTTATTIAVSTTVAITSGIAAAGLVALPAAAVRGCG